MARLALIAQTTKQAASLASLTTLLKQRLTPWLARSAGKAGGLWNPQQFFTYESDWGGLNCNMSYVVGGWHLWVRLGQGGPQLHLHSTPLGGSP